jgi:hypothetical protein
MPLSTNVISRFRRACERANRAGSAGPSTDTRKALLAAQLAQRLGLVENSDRAGTDELVDVILRHFDDKLAARDAAIEDLHNKVQRRDAYIKELQEEIKRRKYANLQAGLDAAKSPVIS